MKRKERLIQRRPGWIAGGLKTPAPRCLHTVQSHLSNALQNDTAADRKMRGCRSDVRAQMGGKWGGQVRGHVRDPWGHGMFSTLILSLSSSWLCCGPTVFEDVFIGRHGVKVHRSALSHCSRLPEDYLKIKILIKKVSQKKKKS